MDRTHINQLPTATWAFASDCLAILKEAGGGIRYQDKVLTIETEPAPGYKEMLQTAMYRDKVDEWGEDPVFVIVSSPLCVKHDLGDLDEKGIILIIYPDRYADYYYNDTTELHAHARQVYLANPPF